MECPVDHSVLQMTERQGVEIDYCPQCRGIWLDRGELDKIIDRAPDVAGPRARDEGPSHEQSRSQQDDDHERGYGDRRPSDDDRQHRSSSYQKKRKESFLGELFDF